MHKLHLYSNGQFLQEQEAREILAAGPYVPKFYLVRGAKSFYRLDYHKGSQVVLRLQSRYRLDIFNFCQLTPAEREAMLNAVTLVDSPGRLE